MTVRVISFDNDTHRSEVVDLWECVFGYDTARNKPSLAIDKKLAAKDDLFFVAVEDGKLLGTVMAGYDGHRGWIYSMAVLPDRRSQGIGSALLRYAEIRLEALGCVKINLQVLEGNESVLRFYEALGYAEEKRISMGKTLAANVPEP